MVCLCGWEGSVDVLSAQGEKWEIVSLDVLCRARLGCGDLAHLAVLSVGRSVGRLVAMLRTSVAKSGGRRCP